MRVLLTNRAHRKLIRIVDYLVARSPSGARNVRNAIETAFRTLETLPRSGTPQIVADIRKHVVPHYGYRLYYTIKNDTVTIVSIRHPSEDRDAYE